MMETIVALYCVIDDVLKAIGHQEDSRRRIGDAEVILTALVAARFFAGNHQLSRDYLDEHGFIPGMLSTSRLNRRLPQVAELLYEPKLLRNALGAQSIDTHHRWGAESMMNSSAPLLPLPAFMLNSMLSIYLCIYLYIHPYIDSTGSTARLSGRQRDDDGAYFPINICISAAIQKCGSPPSCIYILHHHQRAVSSLIWHNCIVYVLSGTGGRSVAF